MRHTLDRRFRTMDALCDYRQIVSLPNPPIEAFADAPHGADLARIANDGMADLVRRHGDRFTGFVAALSLLDVESAIAEFERAIQLNPNYATAHQWINTPFQMVGQFDRAMAETKRAIELDPLSLIINSDLAFIYLNAHRFDDALAQSRKTLEMNPN